MYEANVNTSFNSRVLKAGVVWSQKELETMFGLDANQVSLYPRGPGRHRPLHRHDGARRHAAQPGR